MVLLGYKKRLPEAWLDMESRVITPRDTLPGTDSISIQKLTQDIPTLTNHCIFTFSYLVSNLYVTPFLPFHFVLLYDKTGRTTEINKKSFNNGINIGLAVCPFNFVFSWSV